MNNSYLVFLIIAFALLGAYLYLSQPKTVEVKPPREKRTITVLGYHKQEHEADQCNIRFRVEGCSVDCEAAKVLFSKTLIDISEALTEKRITNKMITTSKNRSYEQMFTIEPRPGAPPMQKPNEKRLVVEQDFEIHLPLSESAPPALIVDALTKQGAKVHNVKFPFSPEFRRAAENECFKYAVEDAKQKALALIPPEEKPDGEEIQLQQLSVQPIRALVSDREERGEGMGYVRGLAQQADMMKGKNSPSAFGSLADDTDYKIHVLVPNILTVECQVKVVYAMH